MPPVPTMPILSHHHHHEQGRQQQQRQQRHHQYNAPPHPPHQQNPSAAATCITPTVSPAQAPAAAPPADAVASHSELSGGAVAPAAGVAPGLPVMTGVPGIKSKRDSGVPCMFGLESVSMVELHKRQVQLLLRGWEVCSVGGVVLQWNWCASTLCTTQ